MTYEEVIDNNCRHIANVGWWSRFAFHYTDVTNAVSILKEGFLYSRFDASDRAIMANDNASSQVIDMTSLGVTSKVRFYFRPLTPTQFHNEGYKHSLLRYCHDSNANVPVPVFFLFDLTSLLAMKEICFSEKSLAGGGGTIRQGLEAFSNLNFTQIYKSGPMQDTEEEKKYRQAEILYPGAFDIRASLKHIYCRNEVERETLLNLLLRDDRKAFLQYKDYVVVCGDCFEKNGLFIMNCRYYDGKAVVVYSNTANQRAYTTKYKDKSDDVLIIQAQAIFEWTCRNTLITRQSCNFVVNYEKPSPTFFKGLKQPKGASALHMKILFEGKLVCYLRRQLTKGAML